MPSRLPFPDFLRLISPLMIASVFIVTTFFPWALAVPHPAPIHVPIRRRNTPPSHVENLPKLVDGIKRKYGFSTASAKRLKRDTTSGDIPLNDEQSDVSYSGVVSIGTPAQEFNMVLDTGSSDLWVATWPTTPCATECISGVPLFDPSLSSTNLTTIIPIDYGSGFVSGTVFEDTVTFGGFAVRAQQFLAVDNLMGMSDMLDDNLSGIMGLGFQTISALQTPPFWQALCNQSSLSQPMFAFYLERHVDQSSEAKIAPGGTFTLGGTNTSLYAGDIEFIAMPSGTTPSYWFQQVHTITIQGSLISVPTNSGLAAIDTGTTLIGAPISISREIWAHVPDSVALTGLYQGMYAYPCDTNVDISISFGGTNWTINAADMNFGTIEAGMCIGGIFDVPEVALGSLSAPSWVIGDVFLKNVYSVFRADPPAVGFAQLSPELGDSDSSAGGPSPSALLSSITFILALLLIPA